MSNIFDTGKDIKVSDIRGNDYEARIYAADDVVSQFPTDAYILNTVSDENNGVWTHKIVDSGRTNNVREEIDKFKREKKGTHIIVIPKPPADFGRTDKLHDIISFYS